MTDNDTRLHKVRPRRDEKDDTEHEIDEVSESRLDKIEKLTDDVGQPLDASNSTDCDILKVMTSLREMSDTEELLDDVIHGRDEKEG